MPKFWVLSKKNWLKSTAARSYSSSSRIRCAPPGDAHPRPPLRFVFTVHPVACTDEKFAPKTGRKRVFSSQSQGCQPGPRSSRPHCKNPGVEERSGVLELRTTTRPPPKSL